MGQGRPRLPADFPDNSETAHISPFPARRYSENRLASSIPTGIRIRECRSPGAQAARNRGMDVHLLCAEKTREESGTYERNSWRIWFRNRIGPLFFPRDEIQEGEKRSINSSSPRTTSIARKRLAQARLSRTSRPRGSRSKQFFGPSQSCPGFSTRPRIHPPCSSRAQRGD